MEKVLLSKKNYKYRTRTYGRASRLFTRIIYVTLTLLSANQTRVPQTSAPSLVEDSAAAAFPTRRKHVHIPFVSSQLRLSRPCLPLS